MDIDKRLNEIILRHDLDRHYPAFRPWLQAQEILREWAGTMKDPAVFVALRQQEIDYMKKIVAKDAGHEFVLVRPGTMGFLDNITAKRRYKIAAADLEKLRSCRKRWNIAASADSLFPLWLAQKGINSRPWQDVCLEKGVYVTDYLKFLPKEVVASEMIGGCHSDALALEYIEQAHYYAGTTERSLRELYEERLFFLSILLRDFPQAKQHIMHLPKDFAAAWREIENLLAEIGEAVKQRQARDILLFWVDAVSKKEFTQMPFLKMQTEKGVDFKESFCVTPYTHPTLKTLFCEKKVIDDASYTIDLIDENCSPLLQEVESNKYEFRSISGYWSEFADKYEIDAYYPRYKAASNLLWETLRQILLAEQPLMTLTHLFMETHEPNLPNVLGASNVFDWRRRYRLGRSKVDALLSFYDSFWPADAVKVFFSDHGRNVRLSRFHTFFLLVGREYRPRKVDEMFSYLDFSKLMIAVLRRVSEPWQGLGREYVEIQDLPMYNSKLIARIIKEKLEIELWFLGYRGVITREYMYFFFSVGREILMRRAAVGEPGIVPGEEDIADLEALPYLRRIARMDAAISMLADEKKLRYSKYYLEVYQRGIKQNERKIAIINEYFDSLPVHSVAIRTGGEHSWYLYSCLSATNREKIACFIDDDPECLCADLAVPVIKLAEVDFSMVDEVMLSSFLLRDFLRKEARGYASKAKVTDLYDVLERRGVICRRDFFLFEADASAYEVGFPFEEIERE